MQQISRMDKTILSTVLLFSFGEVLEEIIHKLKRKTCAGCQCDHPSQNKHECLMQSEQEHLTVHFDTAIESFSLVDVLKIYADIVGKLDIPLDVASDFFFLNAIMVDKLHTNNIKTKVKELLEKKLKLHVSEDCASYSNCAAMSSS